MNASLSAEIRAYVEGQRIARLATVDERNRPHLVPICFALDGETLYTAIDEKPKGGDPARLRRLRNIASNPQVQVLFDTYEDVDWAALRYVQLRGRARVVQPGDPQHLPAVALLRGRYRQYGMMALESHPIIAITVDRAVAWAGRG
ncbi:MAG: TIGR03668 family PPOX class F420-dependent oxidoreductase [Chloroflexi bacterium]|nr:TIGR03668 family PPOX class F420-dependent oxidoreductase [Chloroflexota bacterium]